MAAEADDTATPIIAPTQVPATPTPSPSPVPEPTETPALSQPQSVATMVARAAERTRLGFLAPAHMNASPAAELQQGGAQDDADTPVTILDRLATTTANVSQDMAIALPTPTPTRNPLRQMDETTSNSAPDEPQTEPTPSLAELLEQPVPSLAPEGLPPIAPTPAWSHAPDGDTRTARVPILMYHYLSEPPPGADIYRVDLSVTPTRFAAHLDALQAHGYTAISLYELHAHLTGGAPLPEKPVILTFDDGYRDNYENAFPLLRARAMTATFFIVTDFINEGYPAYLTWDMVREMYAGGMSIEAHGRNHTSLKNRDIDYLVWQALGNLEAIEQEIGVRPRFISYPAGEFDQLTIDIFQSAHYWAGVTTVQGATHSSDRLFELRRVRIRNTTTPEELLRLVALDW